MGEKHKTAVAAVMFQPKEDGTVIYMDQAVLEVNNFELTPEVVRTLEMIDDIELGVNKVDKVEQAKQTLREAGAREEDIKIVSDRRKQLEQDGFDR